MGMRIVVAGATGVVGRRAVAQLVAAGHEVAGVARSPRARAVLGGLGAETVAADVYNPAGLARAFAGREVVVNLLTRIPPVGRAAWPGAWGDNDRLRREASHAVARAARTAGAGRLVQESLALLYADGGERWLGEDAPLDPAGPPATAAVAEEHARGFGDAVVLRFGLFVAPESDQTQLALAQARRGVSIAFGAPATRMPMVWADDAAAAVVAALEAPAGTYNVCDDEPPTRAQVDRALAEHVGRARLRAPLAPIAKIVPIMRPLTRSLRASNRRLRRATGWAPRVRAGIDGWRLAADAGTGGSR